MFDTTLSFFGVYVTLSEEQRVIFQITSSKEATVTIENAAYVNEHYDVDIGRQGNTKAELSYAKKGAHTVLISKDTHNILSSHHPHAFWISWIDHVIRFGIGAEFNKNEVFNYLDPHQIIFKGIGVTGDAGVLLELGEINGEFNIHAEMLIAYS
jgi:hypothetical protein